MTRLIRFRRVFYLGHMGLNIAIQKSGRLRDDSLALLKDAGLKVDNSKDQLKARAKGMDATFFFLRNSDIPKYLEDGVADIAIIGENTLIEKNVNVTIVERLGFSKCRLSIAVPKLTPYATLDDLNGMKIATSYPFTLKQFLAKNEIDAQVHTIAGSVEIAPNIGLADAICDLVSTGSTLFKNGLIEKDIILKSEAVLATNGQLDQEKKETLDQLLFRISSVMKGRSHRYILMNVPNDKIDQVSAILPVLKSPTVLPLVEEGWSSLHSVIAESDFWQVINRLKELGAEGILIVPIEKMVV